MPTRRVGHFVAPDVVGGQGFGAPELVDGDVGEVNRDAFLHPVDEIDLDFGAGDSGDERLFERVVERVLRVDFGAAVHIVLLFFPAGEEHGVGA